MTGTPKKDTLGREKKQFPSFGRGWNASVTLQKGKTFYGPHLKYHKREGNIF